MLIERKALAQERRLVPETIARFIAETSSYANLPFKLIPSLPHTFEPGRTPPLLRQYEKDPDWRLPVLASRYPRCSTDRETADSNHLEWVTPGHSLFEALRRHTAHLAHESLNKGACFYSLQHECPARVDFYRAKVVDGFGLVIHERLFAVEVNEDGETLLREPSILGNFTPASLPDPLPNLLETSGTVDWLNTQALSPFLEEVRLERSKEIERIADHVELSLTELLQKADDEIGRAAAEIEQGIQGAEGRLAQAENRHAELLARRERRRKELEQQRSLTLQTVERITSVLILSHPERETPEVRRLRPNLETEAVAMQVVLEFEQSQGRQVFDVHEKNLGYDLTSLDINSGELRLIEVKGTGGTTGTVLLSPNERRVAEDRRDCYWLYVVTDCNTTPTLQNPIKDPARFKWHEVSKVQHYWLEVNAMTNPMMLKEEVSPYRR